jgi:dihydrofolate reductase
MATITVTTFLSLDGVMQAPGAPDEDRSGGFEHGGWLVPYVSDDMGKYVAEWFSQADGFLLGRRTYEIFSAYWPRVTDPKDPVATALNRLPKHVVSTTLDTVEWHNSRLIKDHVVEQIAALKRQPGRELQVHGSGGLVRTLMEYDLVDEYRLWIYPVVLGSGDQLFHKGQSPRALKLVDSRQTSTGVAIHVYQRGGAVTHGSFDIEN